MSTNQSTSATAVVIKDPNVGEEKHNAVAESLRPPQDQILDEQPPAYSPSMNPGRLEFEAQGGTRIVQVQQRQPPQPDQSSSSTFHIQFDRTQQQQAPQPVVIQISGEIPLNRRNNDNNDSNGLDYREAKRKRIHFRTGCCLFDLIIVILEAVFNIVFGILKCLFNCLSCCLCCKKCH
ncbi:hypothetical protein BDR26DRAFT_848883 [Obelidium mucronatum]|nr:hypothetical protein BDR26DRAFT_848883 [Obelidium mucronatum]